MTRKLLLLVFITAAYAVSGCVKETYDMDRLSKQAHLSPTFGISAVRGDISFSDLVDPGDTVVFNSDGSVKVVFKEDSVISFSMEDFYDLDDMVSFNQSYPLGDLSIGSFTGTVGFTLDQISQRMAPALRSQFVALDGTVNNFPAFPEVSMLNVTYPVFTSFEYATFAQGSLDIQVTNNLTAPLNAVTVRLYNTSGMTPIGNEVIITSINPGETKMGMINLEDRTIYNSITASVKIGSSPGASSVLIDLDGSNVQVGITGRDMKVRAGKVVIPSQTISALDNKDTILFDPGTDVELDIISIKEGNLSYTVTNSTMLASTVTVTFPTALRNSIPISRSISVNPNLPASGLIPVDNSVIDLGTVDLAPYNRLPVEYSILVNSGGNLITFVSTNRLDMDVELLNPDFDYLKGYFGQQTEQIDPDTLDLEIKDILDHITGDFLLSSPSIKLNYSNSFAVPMEVDLDVKGFKDAEIVDLNLNPIDISYPSAPAERDKNGTILIDKNNSSLPQLVSMPPEKIRFAGSAVMNPDGNLGGRNNYIFGDSRFVGNLEVEVPLEFRMNNLQFADTVENFIKEDNPDNDNPFNPEDFQFLRIDIDADNGFPVGISLSISLYQTGATTPKVTIDANDILKPALVGSDGRVTESAKSLTQIEITRDFWKAVNTTDKIIFKFKLNTTEEGSKDVKIYSDYRIDFKAALVLKPDIDLD